MTPETRPYQTAGDEAITAAMRRGCRSLVYCLPTGGGKTIVASMLARRAVARGRSIMFLVHRRELVRQAFETMTGALPGESIGVEAAGWPTIPWAKVRIGSVQSLARRIANIPAPHVVFVDEAHHARAKTWEMVLGAWPKARLVGLTATPERLDGLGLGEWFAELVMGPPPGELIEAGYLAPTRVLRVPLGDMAAWEPNTIRDPVHAYQAYVPGQRALFFGRTVDHSAEVCERFRAAGVPAEHVDGTDTDGRRDRLVRAFRDGGIRVLGNCQLFDEGFDVPGCEMVIVGRHTKSTTRWLQMCGRAMRPGEGKVATVIDAAGCSWDLGLPTEAREWSLEDGHVDLQGKGTAKAKRGEGRQTDPVEMVAGELVEAVAGEAPPPPPKPKKAPPRPTGKATRRDLGRLVSEAKRASDPVKALEEIAASLGYKPGWVGHMVRIHGLS